MIIIQGDEQHVGEEFFVISLTDQPVQIKFNTQIDDVLISTKDDDILISWDRDEWDDNQSFLIKTHDNCKELGNLKCTKFLLKAYDKPTKVWIVAQRN